VARDQDRVCKIAARRRAAITGDDEPWRTRHLAAGLPPTWITSTSTRSSRVSWHTRQIGRVHHFIGAPPAGYILPAGRVVATNRNRPANGCEQKQRKRIGGNWQGTLAGG
jgi:hypothetical protein